MKGLIFLELRSYKGLIFISEKKRGHPGFFLGGGDEFHWSNKRSSDVSYREIKFKMYKMSAEQQLLV